MTVSYNLAGASEASGLAVTKLRALIRNNELVARYQGKDVLIEREELARFVSSLPTERPSKA